MPHHADNYDTQHRPTFSKPRSLLVFGLEGLSEIRQDDDIAELIVGCTVDDGLDSFRLQDGDIVVVTSKIVSKAEGRIVRVEDRVSAIAQETVRVVASKGDTLIVETRHGFVMAAAGVDSSNTAPGTVLLLPTDPDESARRLRARLQQLSGAQLGVVISDTSGRPWRKGLVDIALGAAGIDSMLDHRGLLDPNGSRLDVTVTAVVDEIAAAADLVKGKLNRIPVALIRGLGNLVVADDGAGVRPILRPPAEDLFRVGLGGLLESSLTATDGAAR